MGEKYSETYSSENRPHALALMRFFSVDAGSEMNITSAGNHLQETEIILWSKEFVFKIIELVSDDVNYLAINFVLLSAFRHVYSLTNDKLKNHLSACSFYRTLIIMLVWTVTTKRTQRLLHEFQAHILIRLSKFSAEKPKINLF